jgi:Family of unknown function (DUF6308)
VDLIYGAGRLDRRVESVEDLLREWRVREAEWGELYLEFEPATPPDVLLVEDLAVTMLINSRVAGQAAAAVLRHGASLDLASMPDRGLEETTADERRRLSELIGTMTSWPWVGASLATKTLHKKRPGLVPVLDNQAIFFLAEPEVQDQIARVLAARLGELVTEVVPLTVEPEPIRLSDTQPFLWRRQHTSCDKTVFNFVATFNPFETAFAEFLESCTDVLRFAALAEFATGFWVDYVKPSGATGRYFPDWVVVQEVEDGLANWIVETKGRVWEGTDRKDAAIRHWCEEITELTGEAWRYLRVDQPIFKPETLSLFAELVMLVEQRADAIDEQLIVVPE